MEELNDLHDDSRGAPLQPLPSLAPDISVPLGLMAQQREGSVQFPKTPLRPPPPSRDRREGVRECERRGSRRRKSASAEDSDDAAPSPAVLRLLQEVHDRVSFLEIQVQELRTENR